MIAYQQKLVRLRQLFHTPHMSTYPGVAGEEIGHIQAAGAADGILPGGGFIFMLLPGFLAEAFGTYLVSYAALFFMLIAAAAVIVGLYTICDLKAARNGKDR